MKLLLVRHAEPDYSVDSLTQKGWREAELLAARLGALTDVEAVYVSPLGRARDTAALTLRRLGMQAETLPWLAEFRGRTMDPDRQRMSCSWDFRPRRWKSQPQLKSETEWLDAPLMQGSNVAEVWRETREGLDALLARHGYVHDGPVYRAENNRRGTILCFCHYAIATAMLAWLTEMPPVPLWQGLFMAPSSVTKLVTEERVKGEVIWRCEGYGDLSHLWAAGERPSTAGLFAEVYDGRDTTEPIEWAQKKEGR